jgi:hypothetical protein
MVYFANLVTHTGWSGMGKRLNYSRAAEDRKIRIKGSERLEEPTTAEQARRNYRDVINEPIEDPVSSERRTSHEKIAKQARADFKTHQGALWPIVRPSPKIKVRLAKKQKKRRNETGGSSRSK